jgi:decaprenylphospho-beta-D-erythro-pentofuranosid-2-ulose 2-reductase
MRKILVIGAASAIAEASAQLFAQRGDSLFLLARSHEQLEVIAADLRIRGAAAVHFETFDVNEAERHTAVLERAVEALGGLDIVLVAHGTLPDQQACEQDIGLLRRELDTNAVSSLLLLMQLAQRFEQQGHGTLAVISSVAGDRGRQSNYVYGAAKGMLSIFLQGLRNRLQPHGVQVLTIKPGFVDTPMTAEFRKGLLWAQPETIARGIQKAINRGADVVYLPWFWRYIMWVIRSIPEVIFKRMRL